MKSNLLEEHLLSIRQDKTFNKYSSQLHELEKLYGSDVQLKQYEIIKDNLKTAVNKIHLGKSPGKE